MLFDPSHTSCRDTTSALVLNDATLLLFLDPTTKSRSENITAASQTNTPKEATRRR